MSTTVATASPRASLLRTIGVGGIAIFLLHLMWDIYLFPTLYLALPPEVPLQYVASGLLGVTAFEGGLGTALLGLLIHLLISMVVAAVFVVAAARVPAVGRRPIVWGLLYGLGVLVVMQVITSLSSAPKAETDLVFWISAIASHLLTVGLLLGVLVRRSGIAR